MVKPPSDRARLVSKIPQLNVIGNATAKIQLNTATYCTLYHYLYLELECLIRVLVLKMPML